MSDVKHATTPSPEELERIRLILADSDVTEMLSDLHTCYEAHEDHGGVADEDVDGETVQRARDLELAMNWLQSNYIAPAFPDDWLLAELTKLRGVANAHDELVAALLEAREHIHEQTSDLLHSVCTLGADGPIRASAEPDDLAHVEKEEALIARIDAVLAKVSAP